MLVINSDITYGVVEMDEIYVVISVYKNYNLVYTCRIL
ncbi:hypothetical protein SAMN05421659_10730 [[Clostridium] fimetarium]|uniref:Uncharacterized protein n=1 Tax=[Clostridium] fimetarium TaxID=99656 RepID=A0A1I0Q696_9FIRM|nr:hypothetical protein SAMN05421659_10730 [[Clostridium] fimetarium]